jgi:glyoxylase-like metal-dependent hydrolase (beta-lactamase superfamily II)
MKKCIFIVLGIIITTFAGADTTLNKNVNSSAVDVRLYTLDCGSIDIHDQSEFSDTGRYPHKPLTLVDPCFLIKHNNTWLMWDTGLGDKYLGKPVELKEHGVTLHVAVSILDQLKMLKLAPNDIKYVILSHAHFDHTGNANLFPRATLVMQDAEYQSLSQKQPPHGVSKDLLTTLKPMHKILIDGNFDVFNDGTVVTIKTPGHTVGHQSLVLTLPHTGVVILSGDVYHTREAYQYKQVPQFNYNRADTLASMQRIDEILKNTHGQLIIQHSKKDFARLPKFPAYLD